MNGSLLGPAIEHNVEGNGRVLEGRVAVAVYSFPERVFRQLDWIGWLVNAMLQPLIELGCRPISVVILTEIVNWFLFTFSLVFVRYFRSRI